MYSTENFVEYTHRLQKLWNYIESGGVVEIYTVRHRDNKTCFYGFAREHTSWWNPFALFFVPPHHELEPEIAKDYIRIEDLRDDRRLGEMYFPQYKTMVVYASKYRFLNPLETMLDPNSTGRQLEKIIAEGREEEYKGRYFTKLFKEVEKKTLFTNKDGTEFPLKP